MRKREILQGTESPFRRERRFSIWLTAITLWGVQRGKLHPPLRRHAEGAIQRSERITLGGGPISGQDPTFPFPITACSRCITAASTTSLFHLLGRPKLQTVRLASPDHSPVS